MRNETPNGLTLGLRFLVLGTVAVGLTGCPPPEPNNNTNDNVPFQLEVQVEGNGTVEQDVDGNAVTLTAVPDEGWEFEAWLGDVESTENPLAITLTEDTAITARFVEVPLDADEDGVLDEDDLCPDTPAGAEVDEDGCADSQLDTDGDGVTDDVDLCPDTPADAEVDEDGCADSQLDTDGDGVTDDLDQCPDTPAGVSVGADGCPMPVRDSDEDGVPDGADRCPGTPAGEEVDGDGCSASQLDADGDGVPDADDLCPDTPADAEVDEAGCAPSQRDTDGDGVFDDRDQCPETAPGETVDEVGCSENDPPPGDPVCGDLIIQEGEECEPPNTATCNANCQAIAPPECGNGAVEAGEQCDPPEEGVCDANCQLIVICGNPNGGNCLAAQETPGCSDETCCETVCDADPYCCGEENGIWDETCVGEAIDLCGITIENDDCANAIAVSDGSVAFSNFGALTEGPNLVGECALLGADVWFCYEASCTGFATISLIGSDFDTVMAIYDGCGCPTTGLVVECNDDFSTTVLESRIAMPVVAGESYTLRIGGYGRDRGDGTITIFCGDDPAIEARCVSGAGSCMVDNGSPGCQDMDCCALVCEQDPYCCDIDWDSTCAGTGAGLCGAGFEACGTGGDCATEHEAPACDDEACCQAVCEADAYCCLFEWDEYCVGAVGNTAECQ